MTHDEKLKLVDDLYASTGVGDFDIRPRRQPPGRHRYEQNLEYCLP